MANDANPLNTGYDNPNVDEAIDKTLKGQGVSPGVVPKEESDDLRRAVNGDDAENIQVS